LLHILKVNRLKDVSVIGEGLCNNSVNCCAEHRTNMRWLGRTASDCENVIRVVFSDT